MSDHKHEFEGPVMVPPKPLTPRKGRAAVSNLQGRFEVNGRESFDDGWQHGPDQDQDQERQGGEGTSAAFKTHVTDELAKTILSRNASPDLPFHVSLNPYRGCEHGCIYCFARPTHSHLGLSPGRDFETRLFAKVNAPELLRRELAHPGYVPQPIALGVVTDAYQPCERQLGLTRRVLEVLNECAHPVGLITKSSLIERDIDILGAMAARRQAIASVTLTTLDPAIARTLEPRAGAPARRLCTIRRLTDAGIPVSVSVAPIIPFVTEPELEKVLEAAHDAGAVSAHYTVLRLPLEVSPLFQQWLQAHFPQRVQRVMNRVRDMRGGKDDDSDFARRMHGAGVWADLIGQRFSRTVERLGMTGNAQRFEQLDCTHFRRPLVVPAAVGKQSGNASGQGDLF